MKRSIKNISLALALVMVLSLFAGCGNKENNNGNNSPSLNDTGYAYVPTFKSVNMNGIDYIGASCFAGDKVYFVSEVVVGQQEYDPMTGMRGAVVAYGNVAMAGGGVTMVAPVSASSATVTTVVTENTVFAEAVAEGTPAATADETDEQTPGVHYRDVWEPRLFSLDIESGEIKEFPYAPAPIEEGMEGYISINAMFAGADGSVFFIEERNTYSYIFNLPENFNPQTGDMWMYAEYVPGESSTRLISLNAAGEVQMNSSVNELIPEEEYLYIYDRRVVMSDDGVLYIIGDMAVYAISVTGERIGEIPFETESADGSYSYVESVCIMGDGTVMAITYNYGMDGYGHYKLSPLDFETKKMGEGTTLPENINAYAFISGDENYDFYWSNESYLCGYDFEKGESVKLLSWVNNGIDIQYNSKPTILPDGRVIAFTVTSDYNRITEESITKGEIITLTKTPESEVVQKEIITLACLWLDYSLRYEILNFNRTNPNYRIEVTEYSEYNTNEDYDAGLRKLRTEIIAGNVPDIISTYEMPIAQFAAKGLLEDLTTYIEKDAEIGAPGALIEPVFDALRDSEGRLYQIASGFSIASVLGNPGLVGDEIGWNFDEFYEAYAKMAPDATIFGESMTQDVALQYICTMNIDELINWETGECHFDTDEFKALLEFAKMFPAEYDWESDWGIGYGDMGYRPYVSEETLVSQGKQMLSITQLYSTWDYQYKKASFGGEMTFIGFPTENGNGNAFYVDGGLAMSATSRNKDAVWAFIRAILTEDYQQRYGYGLSTNTAAFNQALEWAMEKNYEIDYLTGEPKIDPETGEKIEIPTGSVWVDEGEPINYYALTETERDQILEVVNSTTKLYVYDFSIYEIILDAATPYFAGARSLEDTVSQIQSRIRLYVNEQR